MWPPSSSVLRTVQQVTGGLHGCRAAKWLLKGAHLSLCGRLDRLLPLLPSVSGSVLVDATQWEVADCCVGESGR